ADADVVEPDGHVARIRWDCQRREAVQIEGTLVQDEAAVRLQENRVNRSVNGVNAGAGGGGRHHAHGNQVQRGRIAVGRILQDTTQVAEVVGAEAAVAALLKDRRPQPNRRAPIEEGLLETEELTIDIELRVDGRRNVRDGGRRREGAEIRAPSVY